MSVHHDKNRIPNNLALHHYLQRLLCCLLRRYSNCFGSVLKRSAASSDYSYPSRETILALHFYCSPMLLFLVLPSYNGSIFSRISDSIWSEGNFRNRTFLLLTLISGVMSTGASTTACVITCQSDDCLNGKPPACLECPTCHKYVQVMGLSR